MQLASSFLALALSLSTLASGSPLQARTLNPTSVTFDGRTFVNQGLVAFGSVPNAARDSYNETLGGFGSAIAFELGSFKADGKGGGQGVLRVNPDRGHNTQTTTDYRARSHQFQLSFAPYSNASTAANLKMTYKSTELYKEAKILTSNGKCLSNGCGNVANTPGLLNPGPLFQYTTGLNANGTSGGNPDLPLSAADKHLSVDAEGFVILPGGFWLVSDEYGPYIHLIDSRSGAILYSIRPPDAIVPKNADGTDNFDAENNPASGRAPNQGFEGLTFDTKTNKLWALLQSATIQDSDAGSKTTNRNTRLLGWQVGSGLDLRPKLTDEYVVQLPQSSKAKTHASSELHIIDSTTFFVLARDGNGFGDTNSKSSYKQADLMSIKGATNIANSQYDSANPITPVAPGGNLVSTVTPTQYQSFVNFIDKDQLAKFGLQNGGAFDQTLIAGKLESLAVVPAGIAGAPNDYFLVTVSDNDFITANGNQMEATPESTNPNNYVNGPYADPYAVALGGIGGDTQIFVYRVTLPGYSQQY